MLLLSEYSLSALDTIHHMDALSLLRGLASGSVHCIVTSPPYYALRDYGVDGQIGLEDTPAAFIARLVAVFREARRVLRDDGTCWVNMGDSYNGSGKGAQGKSSYVGNQFMGVRTDVEGLPPKSLMMIPARLAIAMQDDGWILRSEIVWAKPNPMPESVQDRPTKAHEMIYMFAKSERYFYDQDAVSEPASYDGRNDTLMKGSEKYKAVIMPNQHPHSMAMRGHERWRVVNGEYRRNLRSVWHVATEPQSNTHYAAYPSKLVETPIKAGCPAGGTVLDPFMGSGTTALVAHRLGRHYIGCDLNRAYVELARERLAQADPFKDTPLRDRRGNDLGIKQQSLFREMELALGE